MIVGLGVALLAILLLPGSVASGELIALGLGLGGAGFAKLAEFFTKVEQAR